MAIARRIIVYENRIVEWIYILYLLIYLHDIYYSMTNWTEKNTVPLKWTVLDLIFSTCYSASRLGSRCGEQVLKLYSYLGEQRRSTVALDQEDQKSDREDPEAEEDTKRTEPVAGT